MVAVMAPPEPTQALVERAQVGDRQAFDELAASHRSRLAALIQSRLGSSLRSRLEVDDVLQDSFLRAFQAIRRFAWQGEDSLCRWLNGIAVHVLQELASRHGREPAAPLDEELDVRAEGVSPSKGLRRDERFERLQAALNQLGADQRQAILLARVERLAVKEIARRMNRSPDAVTQLILRAVRNLKASFGDTESLHLPDDRVLKDEGADHGE